jgi:predicted DsbA family dithiol-disulfide isomerase/uncharacterized membrane protein
MPQSVTLNGTSWPRILSFVSGLGMMVASALTIQHFFAANYPASIWAGSFCDISAFFNCDSSAFSLISQVAGVPLGYFGFVVGALVCLGGLFPSLAFERTNKTIALLNIFGVVGLFLFSILYLRTVCPLCAVYYLFAAVSFVLFWMYGVDRDQTSLWAKYFQLSLKHLVTFAVVTLLGAYGFRLYHDAKKEAQSGGVAARVVEQYFSLPTVKSPSIVSPYWTARASDRFEDAPIQVIAYADFLCSDCLYLNGQLQQLKEQFKGRINIAFQFFPLDVKCNTVVEKDLHPGACDLSYIAAYDPAKFQQIHDEIFANSRAARDPGWRLELARRYGVGAALTHAATKELVHQIINTGAEYEKTSEKYAHGIRSTPTMILNNRMVIGTFPCEQLQAIFQALVDQQERRERQEFMENWVPEDQ